MNINRDELAGIFAEACNVPAGSVSPATPLSELQEWDSLAVLALITDVDVRYGIVLDPTALMSCPSVADVAQLVDSTLAGRPNSTAA